MGSLVMGLALGGLFVLAGALVLMAALWAFFFLRGDSWAAALGFGLVCAFALAGVLAQDPLTGIGINFALLLIPVLLAVAGYDLAELQARLLVSGELDESYASRLRGYYVRLGLVVLAGAGLALLGYAWKISIPFVWMVAFAIFGALGLGLMARILLNRQG